MCLICFSLSTCQKSRKQFLAMSLFSLPFKHLFSYPWGRWLPLGFILFYFFVYFISYLVGLCHSLLQCLFVLLLYIVYSMYLLNTHISSLGSFSYSSFFCLESTSDCILEQLLFIFLGLRYNFIHLGWIYKNHCVLLNSLVAPFS